MLDLLHKFILALISGITEFLPVSAAAHRELYQQITGCGAPSRGFILAVHIGCLAAIIACNHTKLRRFSRNKRMNRGNRRGHGRPVDSAAVLDMRLMRIAAIPLLISVLFYGKAGILVSDLGLLALFLLLNGFLVILPRLLSQGNKDSKTMSMLDALLMGLGGAVGVIPGFSQIGAMTTLGLARGAERSYALDFALLLGIPSMAGVVIMDIYLMFATKTAVTFLALLGWIAAGGIAYAGAYLSVTLLRFLFQKADGSDFAYYNWGMALVSFILYLMF